MGVPEVTGRQLDLVRRGEGQGIVWLFNPGFYKGMLIPANRVYDARRHIF